jgi:hypothetical protein
VVPPLVACPELEYDLRPAMLRIYLDNCCLNRPFDDQSQARIRIETEAKLEIQQRIKDKKLELAWSYILDFENQANPFEERREAIAGWKKFAEVDIGESPQVLRQATELVAGSLRPKDALHVACAIVSHRTFFVTTDDLIVKKMLTSKQIAVVNPTQYLIEVE